GNTPARRGTPWLSRVRPVSTALGGQGKGGGAGPGSTSSIVLRRAEPTLDELADGSHLRGCRGQGGEKLLRGGRIAGQDLTGDPGTPGIARPTHPGVEEIAQGF